MKNKLQDIFILSLFIIICVLVIGLIGTIAYCWITYGGKTIDEIPLWALWFMFGGNGR